MKKIIFSLIVLLILAALSESSAVSHQKQKNSQAQQTDTEPSGNYSQKSRNQSLFKGVFALTWLGGFCHPRNKCNKTHQDLWDNQSFTIHGLWPAVSASEEEKSKYQNFAIQNIDKNVTNEMQNFWPPRTAIKKQNTPYWLWDHEYNDHGKDFNQLIKRLNPKQYSKATDKTLQQIYFSSAIDFYKILELNKLRQKLINLSISSQLSSSQKLKLRKQDFQKILDKPSDSFHVQCQFFKGGKKHLTQILICFEVSIFQGKLNVKSSICPSYGPQKKITCDQQTIFLLGFDWKKQQQRVTKKLENNSAQDL